jgi:hypothetical protein
MRANRRFQFNKRGQLFVGMNNGPLSSRCASAIQIVIPVRDPPLKPSRKSNPLLEIVGNYFPALPAQLNTMNVFGITEKAEAQEIDLTGDRCRDGPRLNFCATRFLGRVQQKLAAAKINGSWCFAHTKDSLLAKACDRLILESQFTPGLDTGLHGGAVANIIVHCRRTR